MKLQKCECGSTQFNSMATLKVDFELKDGTLFVVSHEDLGLDNIFLCNSCGEEYGSQDFEEIITN